jgi:hypothetical protein
MMAMELSLLAASLACFGQRNGVLSGFGDSRELFRIAFAPGSAACFRLMKFVVRKHCSTFSLRKVADALIVLPDCTIHDAGCVGWFVVNFSAVERSCAGGLFLYSLDQPNDYDRARHRHQSPERDSRDAPSRLHRPYPGRRFVPDPRGLRSRQHRCVARDASRSLFGEDPHFLFDCG